MVQLWCKLSYKTEQNNAILDIGLLRDWLQVAEFSGVVYNGVQICKGAWYQRRDLDMSYKSVCYGSVGASKVQTILDIVIGNVYNSSIRLRNGESR